MTKQGPTGPKKRARRRQQRTTGMKYTQALRNTSSPAPAPEPGRATTAPLTFRLGDLLAECMSGTPATWEPYEGHLVRGFHSELLACPVPSGAALSLAGALAHEGPAARLQVETTTDTSVHLQALDTLDRYKLSLTYDMAPPLCRERHCAKPPIDFASLDRCHAHLKTCSVEDLVYMGQQWAQVMRDTLDCDHERLGGHKMAEHLVQAATAHGAAEHVIQHLLDDLFEDEDMIDEVFWDEAEAMAVRHAIDRERHRLRTVAREEARTIRAAAQSCPACQGRLLGGWGTLSHAPEFCSPRCGDRGTEPGACHATAS